MPEQDLFPHTVTAHLRDGSAIQACPDAESAPNLFERLRRIAVGVRLELRANGRVVEVAGAQ